MLIERHSWFQVTKSHSNHPKTEFYYRYHEIQDETEEIGFREKQEFEWFQNEGCRMIPQRVLLPVGKETYLVHTISQFSAFIVKSLCWLSVLFAISLCTQALTWAPPSCTSLKWVLWGIHLWTIYNLVENSSIYKAKLNTVVVK